MLRRAVEACVLAVAAVALLVGLGGLHLQLPAGRRAARSLIETAVHDQIAGELEIGEIDALGVGVIVVRDVRLLDPEGRVVLSVARAQGRIDLTALLEREVRVVDLAIRRPRAYLYPSLDGTPSLVRALAPRVVRPTTGPAPFIVSLDRAILRDGRADGVVLGVPIDVRTIDGRASLLLDGVAPRIDVEWVRARLYAPLPEGADVLVRGRIVLPHTLDVSGQVAWSRAVGPAWVRFAANPGGFDLGVRLPPTPAPVLRTLWAPWPLEGDVSGWVVARGTMGALTVGAEGHIGEASVAARGRLALVGAPAYDLTVSLHHVELDRVLPVVPVPIATGIEGHLVGGGLDVHTLTARFDGALDDSRVVGFPIPGGPVAARMEAGTIHIERFEPTAPGLSGRVAGTIGLDGRVEGAGTITADRIAYVQGLERVGGSGRTDASVSYTPGGALRLRGRASGLRVAWGPLRADSLSARYDVSLPARGGVRLDVDASGQGTVLAGVPLGAVTVRGEGDQLTIRASGDSVSGPRSVSVDAVVQPMSDWSGARIALPRVEVGMRGRVFRGAVVELSVTPRRIEIQGLDIARVDGARVGMTGFFEPGGTVGLEGHATNVDLSELSEMVRGKRAPFDGTGDVRVALSGSSARPSIEVDARIVDGRWGDLSDLGLTIAANHGDGRLEVDLELQHRGRPTVAISGTLPVDLWARAGPSLAAPGERDMTIEAFDVALAEALPHLVPSPPPITGDVSGRLTLRGTWAEPQGTLDATITHGSAYGIDDLGLALSGGYDPAGATLEVALSRRGRRIVTATGPAGFAFERGASILPSLADALSSPVDLRLAFGPFDQSVLPEGWNLDRPVQGGVTGTGSLRGTLDDPTIGLDLSVVDLVWARLPWTEPLEGAITATLSRRGVELRRASFQQGGAAFAEIAGRLDLDPRAPPLRVTGFVASARMPDFDLRTLTLLSGRPVTGHAAIEASLAGTPESPQAVVRARLTGVSLAGVAYEPADVTATLEDREVEVETRLRQRTGGTLHARTTLPISLDANLGVLPEPRSPLAGQIDAVAFRMEGFEGFLPEVAVIGGALDAHLVLGGTRDVPALTGSVTVRDGTFELGAVGQRYEQVALVAMVEPERLVLTSLEARDRGGRATASGTASLRGLFPRGFRIRADGRAFPVVRDGVTLADVSGGVEVSGTVTPRGIDATVKPVGLRIVLPPRPLRDLQALEDHPEIDVREVFDRAAAPRGRRPRAGAGAEEPFRITAVLDLGSTVWLKRNDLSLAFDGRVTTRIPWPGPLAMQGSVRLRRGYLTAYGKNFYVQRGDVIFTGEPRFDPLLDVTALYDHPVTPVTLLVTGRFTSPQLAFSAGGLSQEEIVAFLVLGRTEIRGTSDTQTVSRAQQRQATQLLFGLGTSWAQGQLRQAAPDWLPTFSYEQGETGWDTSRVRAGAQITSDLYLEYAANLGAEEAQNLNEARAEWRISRRWAIDSYLGDRGAGGLELLWSYSY